MKRICLVLLLLGSMTLLADEHEDLPESSGQESTITSFIGRATMMAIMVQSLHASLMNIQYTFDAIHHRKPFSEKWHYVTRYAVTAGATAFTGLFILWHLLPKKDEESMIQEGDEVPSQTSTAPSDEAVDKI